MQGPNGREQSSAGGDQPAAAVTATAPVQQPAAFNVEQQQQPTGGGSVVASHPEAGGSSSSSSQATGMPPPPPRTSSGGGSAGSGQQQDSTKPTAAQLPPLPNLKVLAPREPGIVLSPRDATLQQHNNMLSAAAGGGAAGANNNPVGYAATPRSVFTYATQDLSSDSEDGEDDEGGNNGFGKRKIKRTLTRIQRQQRIIAAQNAALLQHQQMLAEATPYGTPQGSPRAGAGAAGAGAAGAAAAGEPVAVDAIAAAGSNKPSPPRTSHDSGSEQPPAAGVSAAAAAAAAAFGGKDVSALPGGISSGGSGGGGGGGSSGGGAGVPPPQGRVSPAQKAFAAAALAAAAAAKAGVPLKDPARAQQDLDAELAVLQELMGDSVQGADLRKRMPWFDKSEMRLYSLGFVAALVLMPVILAGLVAAATKVEVPQVYRILLYFAGWPVIWFAVNIVVWTVMIMSERFYYKQALCYHGKLRRALTFLVWTCSLLVWFHACAWIAPCDAANTKCRYNLIHNTSKMGQTVWRFSLCACLFSLALFVTALLGRLLGRHFYNTAHFNKVASVLWKQYWLVMLSQPRSKLMSQEQLLLDGSGGGQEHKLRHRRGRKGDKKEAAAGGDAGKKGWSKLRGKVNSGADQLLPTHTAGGKPLSNGTSVKATATAADAADAAAAADAAYISSSGNTTRDQYLWKQQAGGGPHRSHGSGSGHAQPPTLASVAEGPIEGSRVYGRGDGGGGGGSSFRHDSLSFSQGMGPDAAGDDASCDAGTHAYKSRLGRLRQKLHRQQHPYGMPPGGPSDPSDPSAAAAAAASGGSWFSSWRSGWSSGVPGSNPGGDAPFDFGDEASKALEKAGGVRAAADESEEVPNDPLLDAGVLQALNVKLGGKTLDASRFSSVEWPRIREGIAIQTYEVLLERYRGSKGEEDQQLKAARRLGKALFQHIKADPTRNYLTRDDFDPFFASLPNATAEADAAFFFFDKENNAVIHQHEVVTKVVEIVQERQDMASSLRDTNSIVSTLEFGIGLGLNIIFLLMYLAVWKIDVAKGFSTITASLMFFSFMFSNSAKNVFEATLFLLVAHAFDVGDMLDIDGTLYRVGKITLLYSTLIKNSGEISLYPNAKLLAAPLINLSRGNCLQSDKVVIHVDTGSAGNTAFAALQAAMQEHFEENERHFNNVPAVRFTGIVNPFKAELTVSWTYNFGPQETGRARKVKSALLRVVQNSLGQLPAMIAQESGQAGGADGALAGAAGQQQGMSEQEQMMMNAAVMGTLAATTDANINNPAVPDDPGMIAI